MNNRFILTICLLGGIFFTLTGGMPTVYAKPGNGVPFEMLQDQIDEIVDAVSQSDKSVSVDCPGGSISDALAVAPSGGRLIITVEGTCVENVIITRDDVTLQGGSGTVEGQITVDAARRVVIDNLTVTGNGIGIQARGNAEVTVRNSTISGNSQVGIQVTQGAFALIENNTINSNGECEIAATDSGSIRMLDNTVESNQPDAGICGAVGAYRDGMIRMVGGNTVNQLAAPLGLAIDVSQGSTFRQDRGHDIIGGNVSVFNMSNADFRDVQITGNIDLGQISVLRMRNPSNNPLNVAVKGDIKINTLNLAQFSSPLWIDGDIYCNGGSLFGSPILIPPHTNDCFAPPPPPPLPGP